MNGVIDDQRFKRIAEAVQADYKMGGLMGGIYEDFAREICARYVAECEQERRDDARGEAFFNDK